MGENIWNNAVEYLKKSRANWWNNDYIPKEKYDIAICQTVLQHTHEPIKVLETMKSSVKINGLVICIELN